MMACAALCACASGVDGAADDDTDATCTPTLLTGEGAVEAQLGEALQDILDRERLRLGAPGVVLAVDVPGQGVWIGTSGVTDIYDDAPVQDTEGFAWGSISKTMVGVILLQLEEEGLLSLDDTVADTYRGATITHADRITLRDLLQHTSGIRDYTRVSAFYTMLAERDGSARTIDAVIAEAADAGPEFEPGTAWAYSNTNFHLLGRIAEQATAQDWATLLRTRIREPLGMQNTWLLGYEDAPACAPLSTEHVGADYAFRIHPAWQWAAGGVAGDVRDLMRYARALLGDAWLPADHAEAMRTRAVPEGGEPADYGLGLYVHTIPCGPAIGHTGSTMGFQSDMFRTDDGITVTVLQNDFIPEVSDIAWAACEHVATTLTK